MSDVIIASSGALESLNKIVVQNKRSATTLTAKKMDIDSKHAIEDQRNDNALIGTREEMFKQILNDAKVIEVDDPTLDSQDPGNQPSK